MVSMLALSNSTSILLGHVPYFSRLFILHCTKRDMGWNQDPATTTHTMWETKIKKRTIRQQEHSSNVTVRKMLKKWINNQKLVTAPDKIHSIASCTVFSSIEVLLKSVSCTSLRCLDNCPRKKKKKRSLIVNACWCLQQFLQIFNSRHHDHNHALIIILYQ